MPCQSEILLPGSDGYSTSNSDWIEYVLNEKQPFVEKAMEEFHEEDVE
uniref:Uncharacterized protein n=1 Tax=Candidatus Kentrum sp. FW TaxID=2126338 RepID=A0A450TLL6_9GAMM|nr:MAG: hypothetical protein BECKFW1821C_GA0114237_101533 [Candidatus Kentron sp. FW]